MSSHDPTQRTLNFCLAGGGSGGHITPSLAIAEALQAQWPNCHVQLACSDRPIDATVLSHCDIPWTPLPARGLRKSPLGVAVFIRGMLRAKAQARTVLTKGNIDAVGLLGGFVAGSVLAAARAQGIPTLMLNLDAVPGRANRWIAARATALATAIEVVRPLATSTKPCTQLDGPPIRMEAQPRDGVTKAQHRAMLDLDPNARLLLVTGASQGAGTLNDLLHFLVQTEPTLLDGWQVLHLAGEGPKGTYVPPTATAKELQAAYDHAGIRARVETFRHTMGLAWGAADLVIARAGASTVGEARCAGVPAVYLPYPWHADGHQWSNAQPSIDEGMAEAVDDRINASQTFPAFRPVIEPLLQGDGLKAMTVAAQRVKGRSGGAQAAKMLLELALA